MRGAATKAMSDIVEERQQSRYAPLPPRPFGLRPAGPLALLLAPHIPPRVELVARASPAGLGACNKMGSYFCASPKLLRPVGAEHITYGSSKSWGASETLLHIGR